MSPLLLCVPFTRQYASAFNRSLSLDTSSVTDMEFMFAVRSAPALPLTSAVGAFHHTACAAAAAPTPSQPACRPSCYASLPTRQSALAFNQPLSLDTSSVTTMQSMFSVRSARALPSASTVGAFHHAACAAAAAPTPCHLPIRTSALLCFPFYSAERVGVQPAAKPGHVQRHEHKRHVFGALRACPTLSLHSRGLPARF
jgi:hypothetical protein